MKLTGEMISAFEQGAYGGERDNTDAGLQAVLDLLERDYSITRRLCAALMPGTFDVVCELNAGHDGAHTCPVTEQKTWSDDAHKAHYGVRGDGE